MSTMKISLLVALLAAHSRAFSLQPSITRNDTPRLEMRARGGGEEEERRIRGSGLDRGSFVRTVGAAALGLTAAAELAVQPSLAVLRQPGERTTAPPNALLLVPALRAKVLYAETSAAYVVVRVCCGWIPRVPHVEPTLDDKLLCLTL